MYMNIPTYCTSLFISRSLETQKFGYKAAGLVHDCITSKKSSRVLTHGNHKFAVSVNFDLGEFW